MGRGQTFASVAGRSRRGAFRGSGGALVDADGAQIVDSSGRRQQFNTTGVDGEQLALVNTTQNFADDGKARRVRLDILNEQTGEYERAKAYVVGEVAFARRDFENIGERRTIDYNGNTWDVVHARTGKVIGTLNEGAGREGTGGWNLDRLKTELAPELNREIAPGGRLKRGADLRSTVDLFATPDRSRGAVDLDFLFGGTADDLPF